MTAREPMCCGLLSTSYNPQVRVSSHEMLFGRAALSRGLEHALVKTIPNPNPQPQRRRRPVSLRSRHYSNPEFPKKNVLEGMVRESRVRPPHPPPLPTPSPGGDEGPSPPRRRQRSHRCRGDGSQQPRASGPGPSPGRGTVTGRRPLTVTTPPTAASGPAMGGERAGFGFLESPTQSTVGVFLRARPPGSRPDQRETHVLCVLVCLTA
jgi:hypothetical protein